LTRTFQSPTNVIPRTDVRPHFSDDFNDCKLEHMVIFKILLLSKVKKNPKKKKNLKKSDIKFQFGLGIKMA